MQTCVALCVGHLCYVYRTMCKNIHVYLVLSTPCIFWYCLSHSFPISELNKIYIIHVSGLHSINKLKFGFTKRLDNSSQFGRQFS